MSLALLNYIFDMLLTWSVAKSIAYTPGPVLVLEPNGVVRITILVSESDTLYPG
jgi:hypothetical protein